MEATTKLRAVSKGEEQTGMAPRDDRMDRILIALEVIAAKGDSGKNWISWLPPVITCGLILVGMGSWAKSTEGDLRQELALQNQRLQHVEGIQERIKLLETYNDNVRVQFAARGWVIDPQSGMISKKGR